jgi:mono/diheme cytochrome c family protein
MGQPVTAMDRSCQRSESAGDSSDRVRDMPAGQLFHIVTYGSGRMPSYASQTSAADRWLIVNYVRTLQHGNGRRQ